MTDLAKLLGPAIGTIVRVALEKPIGAGIVGQPLLPEGRIKIPGRRVSTLTHSLSRKLAEQVATSLAELREVEFAVLDQDEWRASVVSACDILGRIAPVTASGLIAMNLDPDRLFDEIQDSRREVDGRDGLSEAQCVAQERILRECCWQIVEFVTRQPEFVRRIQVELVRRTGDISKTIEKVVERSEPERLSEFEERYRQMVLEKLDALQLFGVTLRHSDAYSLSTAYLSLHAAPERPSRTYQAAERQRINDALAGVTRVLIRGEAGSGKTTLLQWLAVNAVRSPEKLPEGWNGGIPFVLPLRRYAQRDLPVPDQFSQEIAPALSSERPSGWASALLRSGRALVLIDGVDELPQARRGDVWVWLHDLVVTYPRATYVITSRPPAVDGKVLVPDGFDTFMLMPMGAADVRTFVAQWHTAISAVRDDTKQAIAKYEAELIEKLARRRDLRRLATNPLLCALICALHLDRHRQLPQDRMGLYSAALEMLLVRRDEARGINADKVSLSQHDQEALLGQLAYWLVRNGRSDCSKPDASARLSRYMKAMPYVEAKPGDVLDYLLLRSGVLREPVVGTVDFLHKTFQEYLAAQAILDDGDLDAMIRHADEDHWREVVVMVVGHGRRREREKIVRALLERGSRSEELRRRLYLLAVSCLEHPGALDPELVEEVRTKASQLVIPQDHRQVDLVASAGEVVLDVIPDPTALTDSETTLLIDVIRRFDADDALPVFARIGKSASRVVRAKLAGSWPQNLVESFATTVLGEMRLDDVAVPVSNDQELRVATNLPKLVSVVVTRCSPESLSFLRQHRRLRSVMAGSMRITDLGVLAGCPALRSLVLVDCSVDQGLAELADTKLEEIALLDTTFSKADTERLGGILQSLRNLRRLTIDQRILKTAALRLPSTMRLERLDLLAAGWMAFAIDYTHRDAAWESLLPARQRQTWFRSGIGTVGSVASLRVLSISGWPSPVELEALKAAKDLEMLRVVVAGDDLRDAVLAAGLDYGYPGVASGLLRTLRALPMLKQVNISILSLERVASMKWQELRRGYRVVYVRGSDQPALIHEVMSEIPREAGPEIVINGTVARRRTS